MSRNLSLNIDNEYNNDFSIKKSKISHSTFLHVYTLYQDLYWEMIDSGNYQGCYDLWISDKYGFDKNMLKLKVYSTQQLVDITRRCCYDKDYSELNLNWIDTSSITDMSCLFFIGNPFFMNNHNFFNCDISEWNVSNVIDMSGLFKYCRDFNKPLDKWNISKVIDTSFMFGGCSVFNQSLDNWDTSSIVRATGMFWKCLELDQNFYSWTMPKIDGYCVTDMFYCTKVLKDHFPNNEYILK